MAHSTKGAREKLILQTPEDVGIREEAAARCTKKFQRRILKLQARRARVNHLLRCSLEPGKKKIKRSPLTVLYVNGNFTEDREEWQKVLQRHCESVYTDLEETVEA